MSAAGGGQLPPDSVWQEVRAEAGHAYGVIGADLHVIAGRGPVYLLANHRPAEPDQALTAGPPDRPSHLLNARSAVVEFTGRETEVRALTGWRDSGRRLAVCWLHAPGGQGKTRLATHLADDAVRAGWKVIVAEHAAGRVGARHPASQDLRAGAAAGLLLVVDYADRWPLAHLTWLFGNAVLAQPVPVRVLLLARTAQVWPALGHALGQAGWPPEALSDHHLDALPQDRDARHRMFTAARDSFARCYRLPDPGAVPVPDGLVRAEFGLTLALHMAALVAVDRHAAATAPPPLEDTTGLTAYLLARERHHWHTRYDTGVDPAGGRTTFDTTPRRMARAVFTAALTGPLGHREAVAALRAGGVGADPDQVLADHTLCYPPADQGTVLEPLYPDRLAEDFLALCVPGHPVPGDWADAWARDAPALLLAPDEPGGPLPAYAPRAITFLAAAQDRWPHLTTTLAALADLLPERTRGALTVAAADLAGRLAASRLGATADPGERARIHLNLAHRLFLADRDGKAVAAAQEAVALCRPFAGTDPATFVPLLAEALVLSAVPRLTEGLGGEWTTPALNVIIRDYRWTPAPQLARAVAALHEGVGLYEQLAGEDPDTYEDDFAAMAGIMAAAWIRLERWPDALRQADAALAHFRRRCGEDPARYEENLATALSLRAMTLRELDRYDEERVAAGEAAAIYRRLADRDPVEYAAPLQSALSAHARALNNVQRFAEATAAIDESVRVARRLARDDPAEHTGTLQAAVEQRVQVLLDQERFAEALTDATEAVRLARERGDAGSGQQSLAGNLSMLARLLGRLDRLPDAVAELTESIAIRRRLAEDDPAEHEHILSTELGILGTDLATLRRWPEALAAAGQAVELNRRIDGRQAGVEGDLTAAVAFLADQLTDTDWRAARRTADRPAEFTGQLAAVVDGFWATVAGPGRDERTFPGLADAVEAARREIAAGNPTGPLYRRLTGVDPLTPPPTAPAALARAVQPGRDRPDSDRAELLGGLAMALRAAGRQEEALAPACEAVEILVRLARADPDRHTAGLVTAWVRAAVVIAEVGQPNTATAALEQAIGLRRGLVDADPATHEPALAVDLAVLARTLAKQARWAGAADAVNESVELQRRLGFVPADRRAAAEEFLVAGLAESERRPEYLAALRAELARLAPPG